MSDDVVDTGRRRVLTVATSVVGAIGAGFVAVPFLSAMQPSARTRAAGAPVEIDISKLEDGQLIRVEWRGKPVWILRRSQQALADLPTLDGSLSDPESIESLQPEGATNLLRSIKPDIFVALGVCTHLGCSPTYRPEVAPADLGSKWKGGFFCACHGSRFDLAGRVYKGVPAPTNLQIPPHRYVGDHRIIVGEESNKEIG
ncbi:MAG: ubiquinol-cytochrome c reductase iron-sulfur subunit [Methylococcus sp.]|nr:MAG: ubiquinol-cytochrome c reductase iron-sulfur subunit [Methylococcus sp.]